MVKNNNMILFIIRLGIGIIFLAHGFQKLFGIWGGNGVEGVTRMLTKMGFVFPHVIAWLLALGEYFGGLFLILGIFPRFSASVIAIIMLVAITKVHAPNGFFLSNGGFEYTFLIFVNCLTLIWGGGGNFSLYNKY